MVVLKTYQTKLLSRQWCYNCETQFMLKDLNQSPAIQAANTIMLAEIESESKSIKNRVNSCNLENGQNHAIGSTQGSSIASGSNV